MLVTPEQEERVKMKKFKEPLHSDKASTALSLQTCSFFFKKIMQMIKEVKEGKET